MIDIISISFLSLFPFFLFSQRFSFFPILFTLPLLISYLPPSISLPPYSPIHDRSDTYVPHIYLWIMYASCIAEGKQNKAPSYQDCFFLFFLFIQFSLGILVVGFEGGKVT